MRKLLCVLCVAVILAGCAPKVPEGLTAAIHEVYPDARIIEAMQEGSGGKWCVVYQPDASQQAYIQQVFYDQSWIPVNEAWAMQYIFLENRPKPDWCQIPGMSFE